MTPVVRWRWCAAAGVLAFIASWLFGQIGGLKACTPTGGLGPIIAFEVVRSPADVIALFGPEPARSACAAGQRTGLLLDNLWFIPAYTTFLALAAWSLRALPLAALAGFAGLGDEIEGGILFAILSAFPGSQLLVDSLWWAVQLKFALLGMATAGIGTVMLRGGWIARIAGLIVAGAGGFAFVGLISGNIAATMQGLAIGWPALLLFAFACAVRPSLFSVPARPRPAP